MPKLGDISAAVKTIKGVPPKTSISPGVGVIQAHARANPPQRPMTPTSQGIRQDTSNVLARLKADSGAAQAPGPAFPTMTVPALGGEGGTGYDAAFQASIKTARSGVEAQLRNALGEVARQEAAQQAMVNQLPGQLTGLYGQATQQAQTFASEADAAQAKIGPTPGTSSAAANSPMLAAMAMGNATQQAGVPTLGLAVKDSADRQRGGLHQARMESMAQLDAEERQATMARGDGNNANAIKLAEMQNQMALAKYEADANERKSTAELATNDRYRKEDHTRQIELAKLGAKLSAGKATATQKFGAKEISVERGAALKTGASLRKDSSYIKLAEKLRGRLPEEVAGIVAAFEKKNKKASSQAMSMALFDLFGNGQAK